MEDTRERREKKAAQRVGEKGESRGFDEGMKRNYNTDADMQILILIDWYSEIKFFAMCSLYALSKSLSGSSQ